MTELEFFLQMTPVGKGRARTFTTRNGITKTVTPDKTRINAKLMYYLASKELVKLGFRKPLYGPLLVEYTFYLPRPKTIKNRVFPTVKPDADNLEKQVSDTFNSLLWIDDTQIIKSITTKLYADSDSEVGIKVKVKEIISKEQNEGGYYEK